MPLFRVTTAADPAAAELLNAYFAERIAQWGDPTTSYQPKPADFSRGVLLVAEGDDGVALSVGGQGIGRALLRELESHAASMGATRMVLDTNAYLASANRLYQAEGYVAVEPFNDNPNATSWFAKELTQAAQG